MLYKLIQKLSNQMRDKFLTSEAIAISVRIKSLEDKRCKDGTAMTTSDSSGIAPQLLRRATILFTWAMVPLPIIEICAIMI
jgi:hypothetical protein